MSLRDKLRQVVSVKDSPRKVALSFAVGVFIGMSPLIGFHTVLGFAVAWAFRLNKFVTVIGVYITNPWTIIPIYTFATWLGARLLGVTKIIPAINWNEVNFTFLLHEMEHLVWPFIVGTTLLGVFSAVIAYMIIYHAAARNKNVQD